jgi:tRNA(adenine34) deaminase
MSLKQDEYWMRRALEHAAGAANLGEVPVGAVVVFQGQIVGRGYNTRETDKTSLGHAEIMAISRASAVLGRWRLWGCSLYVTLEPCPMCAGAIVHARFPRVVFGAADPRTGACGSVFNLVQHDALNHRVELTSGVLGNECSTMIKEFFSRLRRR